MGPIAFPHSPQNFMGFPKLAPQCGQTLLATTSVATDALDSAAAALAAGFPAPFTLSISASTAANSFCNPTFVF